MRLFWPWAQSIVTANDAPATQQQCIYFENYLPLAVALKLAIGRDSHLNCSFSWPWLISWYRLIKISRSVFLLNFAIVQENFIFIAARNSWNHFLKTFNLYQLLLLMLQNVEGCSWKFILTGSWQRFFLDSWAHHHPDLFIQKIIKLNLDLPLNIEWCQRGSVFIINLQINTPQSFL